MCFADYLWHVMKCKKRHFIDKIDVKMSKTMKNANYINVNVGEKVNMLNIVPVW